MFTTTRDTPMSYTHLTASERIELSQFRIKDKLAISVIAIKLNHYALKVHRFNTNRTESPLLQQEVVGVSIRRFSMML